MTDTFEYCNMETLILGMLEKNAHEIPEYPAIISDHTLLTHSELLKHVSDIVTLLKAQGIPHHTNVAIRFEDPVKHLLFYYALMIMGICQTSINPNEIIKIQQKTISLAEVGLVIQDIAPDNILIQQTIYVPKISTLSTSIIDWGKVPIPKERNETDISAEIIIGSGTTGEPKVFYLGSSALARRITREASAMNYQRGERYFTYTSIHYTSAEHESAGAHFKQLTVIMPRKKPNSIIQFCIMHKIDHISLTGSQAMILLSQLPQSEKPHSLYLPHLKSLSLHSSSISESIRHKILHTVSNKLFIKYGTNEVGECTMATTKDILKWPGTVGHTFKDIDLSIVDDDGNICASGVSGNILIHTSDPLLYYINNPEATQKAFKPEGYYPGDIGKLTEDGNLIFEGRKDDMMIYSGVNIYPRELESVLESHPYVIESAVFPLITSSQESVPLAVVRVNKKVSETELLQLCQNELGWRRPQRIFFADKMPRNKVGKILKRELLEAVKTKLNHKKLSSGSMNIPKIIHQTYPSNEVPSIIAQNISKIKKLNPDWEYRFYDDSDQEAFIRSHYSEEILTAYRRINPLYGAARADFFRYLLIYKVGGVWLDIKSTMMQNLDIALRQNDKFIISQWIYEYPYMELKHVAGGEFQQWHIISAQNNPLIKAVIQSVLKNIHNYTPEKYGVGKIGVLRTTGSIAYTLAIAPLLKHYPHSFVNIYTDFKFRYSIFKESSHEELLFKTHYSQLKEPVILP